MNPTTFLIPLVAIPQTFNINLAGITYIMTCRWNDAPDGGWLLGFQNQVTQEQIIDNIPLICGVDLLAGLEYLGFGGNFIVYTNGNANLVPTLDNLGTDSNLYFISPVSDQVIS